MMKLLVKYSLLSIIISLISCADTPIFNESGNISGAPIMDIFIYSGDYEVLLANKNINVEVPCRIAYKGRIYSGIVRSMGSGTRYMPKWQCKISLDGNAEIEGLNEFNLSAQALDRTMLKSIIALYLYEKAGLDTFGCRHIFLRLNNKTAGLYQLQERIDKKFFERRNKNVYELFELGFKSKLSFKEKNFYPEQTVNIIMPERGNYNSLIELIYISDTCAAANVFSDLGGALDIEVYLKYCAASSLLNNWDGFENNIHFLKSNPSAPFIVIPWDFDKCFDDECTVGIAGKNGLSNKLFLNDSAFQLYKNNIKNMLENHFTEDKMFHIIDSAAFLIEEAYNRDPYLGDGRYDFKTELKSLKTKISARIQYFNANIDLYKKSDYFGF